MRENRKSGSEGGEAQTNELSLPLSLRPSGRRRKRSNILPNLAPQVKRSGSSTHQHRHGSGYSSQECDAEGNSVGSQIEPGLGEPGHNGS